MCVADDKVYWLAEYETQEALSTSKQNTINLQTFLSHLNPLTVLHRLICNVFWGLGDRSYTIMIQYGYQMKD